MSDEAETSVIGYDSPKEAVDAGSSFVLPENLAERFFERAQLSEQDRRLIYQRANREEPESGPGSPVFLHIEDLTLGSLLLLYGMLGEYIRSNDEMVLYHNGDILELIPLKQKIIERSKEIGSTSELISFLQAELIRQESDASLQPQLIGMMTNLIRELPASNVHELISSALVNDVMLGIWLCYITDRDPGLFINSSRIELPKFGSIRNRAIGNHIDDFVLSRMSDIREISMFPDSVIMHIILCAFRQHNKPQLLVQILDNLSMSRVNSILIALSIAHKLVNKSFKPRHKLCKEEAELYNRVLLEYRLEDDLSYHISMLHEYSLYPDTYEKAMIYARAILKVLSELQEEDPKWYTNFETETVFMIYQLISKLPERYYKTVFHKELIDWLTYDQHGSVE